MIFSYNTFTNMSLSGWGWLQISYNIMVGKEEERFSRFNYVEEGAFYSKNK